MTEIANNFIPTDIWTQIASYLNVDDIKKLKFVSTAFNQPEIKNTLWQPFINRLHAIDKKITWNTDSLDSIEAVFVKGLKKIHHCQMEELEFIRAFPGNYQVLSPLLQFRNLITLEGIEFCHIVLEQINLSKIKIEVEQLLLNKPLTSEVSSITRIPESAKKDPELLSLFVNSRHISGKAPLHTASTVDYMEALIANGALIHVVDNQGKTPLHTITPFHGIEKLQCLIKHGANVLARDYAGRSVLQNTYKTESILYLLSLDAIQKDPELGAILASEDNWKLNLAKYKSRKLPNKGFVRELTGDKDTPQEALKRKKAEKASELFQKLLTYPEVYNQLSYAQRINLNTKSVLHAFSGKMKNYVYEHPSVQEKSKIKPA